MSSNALALTQQFNINDTLTLATNLLQSGFLPASIKTVPQAFAIITLGQELGIPAWTALNGINVIQGKPTISPQTMLALINRSGLLEDAYPEEGDTFCSFTMKRKGRSAFTFTFTDADAQAMGLLGKDNWRKQKATMRRWRAISGCARIVFPDIIAGMYPPEEIAPDLAVNEDGELVDAQPVPTAAPKPAAVELSTHNISDDQWREFSAFWKQERQLTYAQLCEILRVQDVRTYPHSMAAAHAAVNVWLINRDREAEQLAKANEIAAALSSRKPDTRAKTSAPADPTPPPDDESDEKAPVDQYIGRAIAAETRKTKTGKAIDLTLTNGGKVTIYTREPIRKLSALWADTVRNWDKPGFHPFLDVAGELEVYSEDGQFKFDIPLDFESLHAEPEVAS